MPDLEQEISQIKNRIKTCIRQGDDNEVQRLTEQLRHLRRGDDAMPTQKAYRNL